MTLHIKIHQVVCCLILPVLLPICLSGCIRESLEGCPLDALLKFTYKPDGTTSDLFGQRVQRVTLCVYRPDGSIEHTQTLESTELSQLQGAELYLPQGEYTVVCWANATAENSKLGGFRKGETITDLFLEHPQAQTSQEIPTLDKLLFATASLSVNERNAGVATEVNFSTKTICLKVLLKGISLKPKITTDGLASALHPVKDNDTGEWKVLPVEQGKTYVPAVEYDGTKKEAAAIMDVPRFGADTPAVLNLKDNAGNLIAPPVSIAELIRKYNIQIGEENEIVIPIEITFTNGHAKITIKDWESQNVKPGGV
ncbi:FimB/Mfa2 family fimbrial subunit [Bacteroides sp. AN502(2024)]|uniref:FimB/Mfa2 family fimbrial subunit n=1 Tax=Bacteroides sp. AN502(2024) TaxID=3160599 RepID=UPI003514972E